MIKNTKIITLVSICAISLFSGCATETSRTVQTQQVIAAATPYVGKRVPVSIGKFENRSPFMRGIFSDGVDRLGNQSKTILIAHLNQSNRFSVLDRENMSEASQEAKIKNQTQKISERLHARDFDARSLNVTLRNTNANQNGLLGFGSTASYDATLNGKVLDLSIREAVDKLSNAVDSGALNKVYER